MTREFEYRVTEEGLREFLAVFDKLWALTEREIGPPPPEMKKEMEKMCEQLRQSIKGPAYGEWEI